MRVADDIRRLGYDARCPSVVRVSDTPAAAPLTAADEISARLGAKPAPAETDELVRKVSTA